MSQDTAAAFARAALASRRATPLERRSTRYSLVAIVCAIVCDGAQAQQKAAMSAHDLAKLVQNPLADSISVPFANETNFPLGPYRGTGNIMNIQPVVPFRLSDDWNIITRTTIPVVAQPRLSPTEPADFGIGSIVPIIALSPAHPGDIVWGLGPTFSLPTATGKTLGSPNWAAGPAAILLVQPDPWSFGLLLTHMSSFAGPSDATRTERTAAQLFAVYNFDDGTYLSYSPIFSADWTRRPNDRWTVPVGGEIGRVFEVGGQAMSASAGAYYNVVHPDGDAAWQIRTGLTLIFPK